MAAFGAKRAGDIFDVVPLSRIVGFAHRRISRDGRQGSVPWPVTRHGEDGRPRTEGGRICNRNLAVSGADHFLTGADAEIVERLDGSDGLVGLGPESEQIVSRLGCRAGGADDGAIVVA